MIDEPPARRRQIADAALRLVASGGVRAATVRAVASETGLAMGSVRHVFASQDELRRAAMTAVITAIEQRLVAGADERTRTAAAGSAVAAAAEVCEALLPLDAEREREARVYAAFLAEAATDAGIAAIRDDAARRLRAAFGHVVESLATLGALGAGRDVALETDRLWALVDGLSTHLLDHPDLVSPDRAHAVVRAHLNELTAPDSEEHR